MIGQTLNNRYNITDRLGKGAMGIVYRATNIQTGQEVALKLISSELAVNPEMLERFKREGEALRKLKHPNIVGFIDAFQHDEQYVIVMEYIPGGSLHELIQGELMPIERARQIALDLCDALIRAHRLNIIHRDIKPENVLIDEDGTPKLADFGVAKLSEGTRMTRNGMQVGTPYYMAPEAWKGETLDGQADIWSLGILLFEMFTNQVPFGGDTGPVVMNKVFTSPLPDLKKLRAEVPPRLIKIVGHMLTREKKRRYQTMREVAVDLERSQEATIPRPMKEKDPRPKKQLDLGWLTNGLASVFSFPKKFIAGMARFISNPLKAAASSNDKKSPRFMWILLAVIAVSALFISILISNIRETEIYYTALDAGKSEIYEYKNSQNILILNSSESEEYWHPMENLLGNLYFTSTTSTGQVEIFVLDTNKQKLQVTNLSNLPFSSWSPAYDRLGNLYFASDRKDHKTEIYVLDSDKKTSRVTTTGNNFESWSPAPDGLGNLYFVSNRFGDTQIFVLKATNKETSPVTHTAQGIKNWSPAPDGLGNLYFVSDRNGSAEIFVLDANGKTSQVTGKEDDFAYWSPIPDGFGNLYFTSDKSGKVQIFMMNTKGVIQVLEDIPSGSWLKEISSEPSTPETIK